VTEDIHQTENSIAQESHSSVLPEVLRQQYLKLMGIQTWFDPAQVLMQKVDAKPAEKSPIETSPIEIPSEPGDVVAETVSTIESKENILKPVSGETVNNIQALSLSIEQCQLCELHTTRQQAITGEGDINANLLIIIDAPVRDKTGDEALLLADDKKILAAMLQAININLAAVYLTSLVKCQPPEQRTPYTSEMICCDEHLSAQIKMIQPAVIMILGEQASQQLLVSQKSLTDLRLRQHKHMGIPVYASYHPRECFNSADTKRKVWADLLQISKSLN